MGNRGRGPEANARDADKRAEALRATITKLRAQGISTNVAIARELNSLGIPAPRGGQWYRTTVYRLLKRLEGIECLQRSQGRVNRRPKRSCRGVMQKPLKAILEKRQTVAAAFATAVRELQATRFLSRKTIMEELERRSAPTERGGRWHLTTVTRMLKRLGMEQLVRREPGPGAALHREAFVRAETLSPIILEIQSAGIVTQRGIASALNTRGVPGTAGGRWHPTSVHRLLHRLARLKALGTTKHAERVSKSRKKSEGSNLG